MSVWEDAKKNLAEWYAVTADKTSELARVTSRKYDKFGLSRDVERQFSELGALVYAGLQEEKDGILEDQAVTALVTRIQGLETALRLKEEEIETIKREHAERKAAADRTGAAATADPDMPTVMTEPALEVGGGESAILVEPAVETTAQDKVNPENQG